MTINRSCGKTNFPSTHLVDTLFGIHADKDILLLELNWKNRNFAFQILIFVLLFYFLFGYSILFDKSILIGFLYFLLVSFQSIN